MTRLDTHEAVASDRDLQRADGLGQIIVSASGTRTRLEQIVQRSPIRILFPQLPNDLTKEAVIVNTAGGIAGGDRLEFGVTALQNSSVIVTSQAAEKVYRALNLPAWISTKLDVHEDAKLAWLPQETIVFNEAQLFRETEIQLSSKAEILALECLVMGRSAHGEHLTNGQLSDTWRVWREGRLIWADSFRVTNDVFSQLHRRALLADAKAVATLVYSGSSLEKKLELVRDVLPALECEHAATSLNGLIIVRFAARGSLELRTAIRGFLEQFSPVLAPGPFRVPKMWLC